MVSSLPLLIYGIISESDSGVNLATVKCRNETTNQVLTTQTNSDGAYLFDLSNMSSGWADGQQITIYTIYSDFEGQNTFTIALPVYGYEKSIALSAVTDSELIDYCTVQDVYDEMDGKTATDISAERIIKSIQRAEGLIDLKTNTSFKSITVTDEIHTADRYTLDISPDFLDSVASMSTLRRDAGGAVLNRVTTFFSPIISISSLSVNQAGFNSADSWNELTQQTGSSGDYIIEDAEAGIIDFLTNYPRIGKRSWKLTYAYGYDRTSTNRRVVTTLKAIERLTILLSVKSVITSKSSGSTFDSTQDVRIGTIEVKAGAKTGAAYLMSIQPEIDELWRHLGELGIEVI